MKPTIYNKKFLTGDYYAQWNKPVPERQVTYVLSEPGSLHAKCQIGRYIGKCAYTYIHLEELHKGG